MIGWWIVISSQTPGQRDGARDKESILATWETGVGGLDWLDKLAKEGKANQLQGGGYPNRYVASARDVLPLIAEGPPAHRGPTIIGDDYVMPGGWSGKVTLHRDKIAACPHDLPLTIDAWDQS